VGGGAAALKMDKREDGVTSSVHERDREKLRESLARSIDPEAWDRWYKERGGIAFCCFATLARQEAAFAKADAIIAPSLAKADAMICGLD
jgi:hypothetical protein